ncbi:MAG: type II toxin-antitoxin system VapC family toxin [Halococcoides sp.]
MADREVVFDAEPLVAYYWDEPGADAVQSVVDDIESGRIDAAISPVTCTEVQYVAGRDDPDRAAAYVERIRHWSTIVPAEAVWADAAAFKRDYAVALGDAFTLATAAERNGTALVGADGEFEGVPVDVERIRETRIE